MHNLRLEFDERFPDVKYTPIIGDVRQLARLDYAFRKYRPQVVFHAAAYKHVPLMEENPCEAVLVNVAGSRNVADKCIEYDVEKMVMVSTDKAVNPVNVMGASKRLCEMIIQTFAKKIAAGKAYELPDMHADTGTNREIHERLTIPKNPRTEFCAVRFGNVLGSNGSVIPRFREQIENGGPVTVTHPDIIRYFMTIPEASCLVLEAATLGNGGEIFCFDMGQPVRIADLATNMIRLAGLVPGKDIKITFTGLRPGEKLYEELLNQKETTIPTKNNKILVAKVREYDFDSVSEQINLLIELAERNKVFPTVQQMKAIVPEFRSKNSVYEKLDK
jgi:FlaA1/EpsC-like NDP-sugar epimerase